MVVLESLYLWYIFHNIVIDCSIIAVLPSSLQRLQTLQLFLRRALDQHYNCSDINTDHIKEAIEEVYYGIDELEQALNDAATKSAKVLGW